VVVAEDLDLDVAAVPKVRFAEHSPVAERRLGLATGGHHRVGQLIGRFHDPHSSAAASG